MGIFYLYLPGLSIGRILQGTETPAAILPPGGKSNISDLDLAEADAGIQQDYALGIIVVLTVEMDAGKGSGAVVLHPEPFGDKQRQLAKGAGGVDAAIRGNGVTTAEINGHFAEGAADVAFL
jgi:hypothetical protein